MQSFARQSFFRLLDLLVGVPNPGLKLSHWTIDGVEFVRERYSFAGRTHGFAVEVLTLVRGGRRGWTLIVVKEYWWAGDENKAIRSLRWAKPIGGRRTDVMAWLRDQELALDAASRR